MVDRAAPLDEVGLSAAITRYYSHTSASTVSCLIFSSFRNVSPTFDADEINVFSRFAEDILKYMFLNALNTHLYCDQYYLGM